MKTKQAQVSREGAKVAKEMLRLLRLLLLLSLVLIGPATAQHSDGFGPEELAVTAPTVTSGGGGSCTVNTGNVFNESFEGTGYENSWTEVGTPDEDYAIPGTSPCSGLGSQSWRGNYTTGSDSYAYHDLTGTVTATRYLRFYFYIASHSLASNNDFAAIFAVRETTTMTGNSRLAIRVVNASGQLQVYGYSTGGSTAINISTATWYRVEVMSVNNDTTSVFRLYNAAGTQLGSDSTFASGNYYFRYLVAGRSAADNTQNIDVIVDGIGVDDTTYLGQ